jgi:hypothetical protein
MNDLLGRHARDVITGFTGVITGYVRYLSGCNQALVAPKAAKDGSLRPSEWIDEQRLEIDLKKPPIALENGGRRGFDRAAPKR